MNAGQYQLLEALVTVLIVLAVLVGIFAVAVLIGRGIDARERQIPLDVRDPQVPR